MTGSGRVRKPNSYLFSLLLYISHFPGPVFWSVWACCCTIEQLNSIPPERERYHSLTE